jgi:hypothetical protein
VAGHGHGHDHDHDHDHGHGHGHGVRPTTRTPCSETNSLIPPADERWS